MTRSQRSAPRGVQLPQILHVPDDVHGWQEADEAIELAEAYGPPLDEAQKITLRAWMGTRADGTWAAAQACHAVSRQNGKGDELQVRELFGLTQLGETIIHTAQELPTAKNAMVRLVATLEAYDDLRRLVRGKPRYANGDLGITLRSGAEIKYRARTGPGARGLDDVALIVYDEAQHLKAEHMAASSATGAVHPNPQTLFTGSPGMAFSDKWWGFRLDALRKVPGRWSYVEHTAERCSIDEHGRFVSVKPDPADVSAWAAANPAFDRRIPEEFFATQLRLLGPELFAREHLGVWDPLPEMLVQAGAKIPADRWAESYTEAAPQAVPGEVAMAYDVEVDGSFAAVSVATGSLSDGCVECIEHRPGVGWLPTRMVELVRTWKPPKVLVDGGSGAAMAVLGDIREALERAGLSADVVEVMSSAQYRAACGSFVQAVIDGKVQHPVVPNDRLHGAGLVARERVIGEAFVFDRRTNTEPIVALTSAAMARSVLSDEVPRRPVFAV